jgi:hypothetical protein
MCQYCGYGQDEGWDALLQYDETYKKVRRKDNYGFQESWDELREQF